MVAPRPKWVLGMASIPFDKLGGKLWYNGEMVDWDEGRLHILSHGLHYGSRVFEGERLRGKIFKHQEYTDRLFKSAEILGMTSATPTKSSTMRPMLRSKRRASPTLTSARSPGAGRK